MWGASQEAAWQVGSEGQAWRPLTKTGRCGRAEVSPSAALGRGVLSAPESYSSSSPKHTEAQGLISQLPTGSYWGLFSFDTSSLQGLRAEDVPRPGNKPPGRELQVFTQAPSVLTECGEGYERGRQSPVSVHVCVCAYARVCGARARKHGHKIRGTLRKGTKMGIKKGKVPASWWRSVKGAERVKAEQSQGCSR